MHSQPFYSRLMELGRITIPADIRKKLKLEKGNYIKVIVEKVDHGKK